MGTIRDEIKAAIFGQESSNGRADTSQENYATARGPMQVTKPTFEGLKATGAIPANWDHANPEHTMKAGNILIDQLADKYDDNPRAIAAAYYAGEKAVRPDGSIVPYKDLKNPNAPDASQYADQVVERMGISAPAAGTRYDISNWRTTPMPDLTPKAPKQRSAIVDIAPLATPGYTEGSGTPVINSVQKEAATTVAANQEVIDTGFGEKVGLGWLQTTMLGSVAKEIARPQFERTVGYNPRVDDTAAYEGKSADDQAYFDEAVSKDDLQHRQFEVDQRNEDLRKVNLSGTGVGIAAMIAGGAPEGILAGMGAAKAFQMAKLGSSVLAAQGRRGAAIASNFAEQAAGNIVPLAVQDINDPYIHMADYAMGAGFAMVGTGLSVRGIFHDADAAAHAALGQKIMDEAAVKIEATRSQARANLGADASPEDMAAEMGRIEAAAVRKEVASATAPLGEDRQLLPADMFDEPKAEAAAAKSDVGSAPAAKTDKLPSENPDNFDAVSPEHRKIMFEQDSTWRGAMKAAGEGWVIEKFGTVKDGLHVQPGIETIPALRPAIRAAQTLVDAFLPGSKIVLGKIDETAPTFAQAANKAGLKQGEVPHGIILSAGKNHVIGLSPQNPTGAVLTVTHEVAHAVFHENWSKAAPDLRARVIAQYSRFNEAARAGKATARFDRFHIGSDSVMDVANGKLRGGLPLDKYALSFDEWAAEGGVRFVQGKALSSTGELVFDKGVVDLLRSMWEKFKGVWEMAKSKGYLGDETALNDFFQSVLDRNLSGKAAQAPSEFLAPDLMANFHAAPGQLATGADPIAEKYGLTTMPQDTPQRAAEYKAIRALYAKADEWAKTNPIDESRLKSITDNSVFNVASTGMLMLKSDNPVVRMIASELLESASGAAGRRSTAAIAKYMNEQAFMGNSINELTSHYTLWRNQQGGNAFGDFTDGQLWKRFNRMVAEEIEGRRSGTAVASPNEVVAAANTFEAAYTRMRVAQVANKTLGWASLPATSKGYMPHRMSDEGVRNMTNSQELVLHSTLAEQFKTIDGFDEAFSKELASKYIDRVKRRALGGFDAPSGVHQVGAADIVKDALDAMGMTKAEVEAAMTRYMKGSPGHTKARLKLDLNQEHFTGGENTFTLMDFFETDQLKLLRSQAQRVSGEVALARHGVMGKPGLQVLREAMKFGADGGKAKASEVEAFDQVAAELLGAPFGNHGSKWLDRAMQANSLARLGGMGFTQFAEYINGVAHVGMGRVMTAVAGMPRLIGEARALARGEKVDNAILSSLEVQGGAEFGTRSYKMVFPFDNGNLEYQTYGRDTVTFADRALRGASHMQAKLSFWRAIHSAQQRGMAEQIVHKAMKFVRDGGNDAALDDMGIGALLRGKLRTDLADIATFDSAGNLQRFDITKFRDTVAADEFIQAVHRGASQIIQDTFIGETGKWAHSGYLRLLTQFRSFGITSIEKQWARQVGNHGPAAALGIMLGSMAAAAPIYIARTVLASQGRADKEEYLAKQLSNAQIARASLNYIALSGLAGDFLDAFTAVSGVGTVTGARTGAGSSFIGNVMAPAAGLVDDVWRGIQNTKEGTDPHDLLKSLPFSRLPWMIPAIEGLSSH